MRFNSRNSFRRQNAAGTLNYLSGTAVPQLRASLPPGDAPQELAEPFVRGLEFLMLAQAQECVWQRAVMGERLSEILSFSSLINRSDNYKNGLIAKLAAKVRAELGLCGSPLMPGPQVSSFYGSALTHIKDASIRHIFPSVRFYFRQPEHRRSL